MENTLKHLRAIHFLLLLTAAATTYFSFAENSEPKKLVSQLIFLMREGPYEYSTFEDMGIERLAKYPTIVRNFFRLSYRKLDDIPAIISEIEGRHGANPSVLGIQLVSTHILTAGSLVQLFILLYLYIVVRDARVESERGCSVSSPVPWIGVMQNWPARFLVWSTIVLVPTASTTLAFLYFPSFLGIALVSFPVAVVGVLVARESGRLTNNVHRRNAVKISETV